jgi:hypothetical protein
MRPIYHGRHRQENHLFSREIAAILTGSDLYMLD